MRTIVLAATLLLTPALAQAEEIKAKVNGIICAYCAQGIEKAFKDLSMVDAVKVDLDHGLVTVTTDDSAPLPDAQLKEIVTDAGYTVTGVERK